MERIDIDLPGCNPTATITSTTIAATVPATADASKPTANPDGPVEPEPTEGVPNGTETNNATATNDNEAGIDTADTSVDDHLPNNASNTPTIIAAVVVVLLLLLVAIALYAKRKNSAQLPEDQDAHIVENKTFGNPQYSANEHQGGVAGSPSSADYMLSTGNDGSGDGTSDIYKVLHTHARDSGGHGLVNNSSSNTAALYAVPMEDEEGSEGDGTGTFHLPRGRSGTVVAAAASGAYEVVAATEGVYAPAAASAAGIRVMAAGDGSGYAQANHYSSTSSSRASASNSGDYDHLQRNANSNYHDNTDFGNGMVDGNNSYDMVPPGRRSSAWRSRTNNRQASRNNTPAASAAPVCATPSPAAGATDSNEQYEGWTVNEAYASADAVPTINPTYAVYAGSSNRSGSGSTADGNGYAAPASSRGATIVSVYGDANSSGSEGSDVDVSSSSGTKSTVARGRGQGKSVYNGFNDVEDVEV